jgi:hypothetical protein
MPLAALLKSHSQRLRDGASNRFGVVGIYEQRTFGFDSGSREAGQYEDAGKLPTLRFEDRC